MFSVECPPMLQSTVEALVYAAAPAAMIEREREQPLNAESSVRCVSLYRILPTVRSATDKHKMDGIDHLRFLLSAMDRLPSHVEAVLSVTTRQAARREVSRTRAFSERISRLSDILPERITGLCAERRARGGRVSRWLWDTTVLVVLLMFRVSWQLPQRPARGSESGRLFSAVTVLQTSGDVSGGMLRELASALAPFARDGLLLAPSRMRRGTPVPAGPTMVLSPEEVAALWAPPPMDGESAGIEAATHRELEPPVWIPTTPSDGKAGIAVFGEAAFRGRSVRCGLRPDDRMRHLVVIGKTGTGKSTLLERLAIDDMHAGHGIGVIDPHGQLIETLVRAVPRRRTNEVVLFDAADTSYPVGFNPLRCERVQDRPLVASGVLAAFKKLYPDFFGPRMEHIFRNALLACVAVPDLTLVHVQRLLSDARFRKQIVARVDDPVVRHFWETEFAAMPQKLQAEAVSPVQNKVGAFVSHPVLRRIVGQPDTRLDVRRVMDSGGILLCSVSKGRIGDDGSALLGSLLVTSLQLAAMSRADMAERDRRPFHLTVDEFGSFATDGFASILAESRKYRLSLTAALQYLGQATPATLAALFGNVGSLLSFQCGVDDAQTLAEQLGTPVRAMDLLGVPRFHAYARLLADGQPTSPFTMRTLPPATLPAGNRTEAVRRMSRRRFARSVEEVEATIRRTF